MQKTLIKRVERLALRLTACAAILLCATPALGEVSPGHRLEPGLQGQNLPDDVKLGILPQPYSKGVRIVGHTDTRGRDSNVQLTWSGHCAYVSSSPVNFLFWAKKPNSAETSGVAVIDVSDPRNPKSIRLLREPGALYSAETFHAVTAPDRKVLVAGAYAGGKPDAKVRRYR